MRKVFVILLVALLGLLSCTRETEPQRTAVDGPEGRVNITFTLEGDAVTKALGEDSQLETMHLAVFGSSGYLKEYVRAELTQNTATTYTCTASIALSASGRRVHFIGNGPVSIPFGRDYEVLPSLLCEKETGYWAMIVLPGIYAKQDPTGSYYVNPQGEKWEPGDEYLPSEETSAAFQDIPLIRNWSKIVLQASEEANFTPISFAVVNVPAKGTLVPYGGVKGFIPNYKDLSFEDLCGEEYNYAGNLPVGTAFDSTVPTAEDFENFTGGVKQFDANASHDDPAHAVYLYERPIPGDDFEPSYVVVYGWYNNPDDASLTDEQRAAGGVKCYYKVDLMSGSEYYPVLRNFKYQVKIDKITAIGHRTPAAAAAAAGSADVSADVNASHLSDISDGTRRMAVQPWMSKTFIRGQAKDYDNPQLFVTFYDDINADAPTPNMRPECVYFTLSPATGGPLREVEIGPAVNDPGQENHGWRPIYFAIADPDDVSVRTQTLRISCKSDLDSVEESPLYRDIEVTVLPRQPMRVVCRSPRVVRKAGQQQIVDLSLPDGLVQSMFPLEFAIEPTKMTLTPDYSIEGAPSLPVLYGESIQNNGKQNFYFLRTITWEEYRNQTSVLDYEDDSRWRTFSSYFKTNCDNSGTDIWVTNEFFVTNSGSFVDYQSFVSPRFTTSIPRRSGAPVSVSAQMLEENGSYEKVYLQLVNLIPANNNVITWNNSKNMYMYTPASGNLDLAFLTTTETGDVAVTLRTDYDTYEPVTLTPKHFSNFGFVDGHTMKPFNNNTSNVAYGYLNSETDKNLLFGFCVDPSDPAISIDVNFPGLDNDGTTGAIYVTGTTPTRTIKHPNNYTGRDDYFTTDVLRTNKNGSREPADFYLASVGYVEERIQAGRAKGSFYSSDANLKNNINNFTVQHPVFSVDQTINGVKATYTVQFDKISSITGNGVVLDAGDTYTLSVSVQGGKDGLNCELYYVQLTYYVDGADVRMPQNAELVSPVGSVWYNFLGANNETIWSIPRGETTGLVRLQAPAGAPIVITDIALRSFRGTVNDTGNIVDGDTGFENNPIDGGNL